MTLVRGGLCACAPLDVLGERGSPDQLSSRRQAVVRPVHTERKPRDWYHLWVRPRNSPERMRRLSQKRPPLSRHQLSEAGGPGRTVRLGKVRRPTLAREPTLRRARADGQDWPFLTPAGDTSPTQAAVAMSADWPFGCEHSAPSVVNREKEIDMLEIGRHQLVGAAAGASQPGQTADWRTRRRHNSGVLGRGACSYGRKIEATIWHVRGQACASRFLERWGGSHQQMKGGRLP